MCLRLPEKSGLENLSEYGLVQSERFSSEPIAREM